MNTAGNLGDQRTHEVITCPANARERQNKTIMRYHLILIESAKIERVAESSAGKGREQWEVCWEAC